LDTILHKIYAGSAELERNAEKHSGGWNFILDFIKHTSRPWFYSTILFKFVAIFGSLMLSCNANRLVIEYCIDTMADLETQSLCWPWVGGNKSWPSRRHGLHDGMIIIVLKVTEV
jgi:hypothetical protein